MNIVHVVNGFDISGRSRIIHELCLGLRSEDFRFSIASLSGGCRYSQGDVDCRNLHRKPQGFDWRVVRRLRRMAKRRGARIIHTHGRGSLAYAVLAANGISSCRFVHSVHRSDGDRISSHAWVRRFLLGAVDRVAAVSEAALEAFCEVNQFDRGRCVVIHNGIDPSRFENSGEEKARATRRGPRVSHIPPRILSADGPIVGTIANLSHDKDIDTVLQSFKALHADLPNARLVVAGDGPRADEARRMVSHLGLKQAVAFLGFRTDIPKILAALDIFVFSTHTEGFGLAVLEAMAAGLPVVVSRVGGLQEIVEHEQNGLLVAPGDSAALCAAVRRLIDDASLREALIEGGRRSVYEEFSLARMCESYRDLYRSVAERR